jgi:hypothetical protein
VEEGFLRFAPLLAPFAAMDDGDRLPVFSREVQRALCESAWR